MLQSLYYEYHYSIKFRLHLKIPTDCTFQLHWLPCFDFSCSQINIKGNKDISPALVPRWKIAFVWIASKSLAYLHCDKLTRCFWFPFSAEFYRHCDSIAAFIWWRKDGRNYNRCRDRSHSALSLSINKGLLVVYAYFKWNSMAKQSFQLNLHRQLCKLQIVFWEEEEER